MSRPRKSDESSAESAACRSGARVTNVVDPALGFNARRARLRGAARVPTIGRAIDDAMAVIEAHRPRFEGVFAKDDNEDRSHVRDVFARTTAFRTVGARCQRLSFRPGRPTLAPQDGSGTWSA